MKYIQNVSLVKLLLFLSALLVLTSCRDDDEEPDPIIRYQDQVFQEHVKTENVTYGQNTTVLGNPVELKLDVYEPKDDEIAARPLVILAHGGYFTTGSKSDLADLAIELTHYGYVTASINYRKWEGGIPVDSTDLGAVAVQAMGDVKAAIRYLKQSAITNNDFGIDDSQVILLGYSSGALAALLAGYLDNSELNLLESHLTNSINLNGGIEGNSGTPGLSTEVKAVISIAGSLFHKDIISPSEPKLLSIHGDADEVMPYCSGTYSDQLGNIGFKLEGPCAYHQRANDWGITNETVTIDNGDHSSPFNSLNKGETNDKIINFLYDKVVK